MGPYSVDRKRFASGVSVQWLPHDSSVGNSSSRNHHSAAYARLRRETNHRHRRVAMFKMIGDVCFTWFEQNAPPQSTPPPPWSLMNNSFRPFSTCPSHHLFRTGGWRNRPQRTVPAPQRGSVQQPRVTSISCPSNTTRRPCHEERGNALIALHICHGQMCRTVCPTPGGDIST